MKTSIATVDEILAGAYSPLPLEVIPNYMGINLCSVESISWTKQNDGQLVSLSIHFLPAEATDLPQESRPEKGKGSNDGQKEE